MASNSKSFSHLFNSNATPRPLEGASIQHKVDDLTTDIEGVKSQIERLQRQLKELEGQRHSYQALLSPLRRIPLEIHGEIFAHILADIDPENSERPVDTALINLCLVCRAWRNAALATPRLWNHLVLDGLPTSLRSEVVSHWFSRSGVAPNTLQVFGDSHEGCQGPEGCEFSNVGLAKLLTDGPQLSHLVFSCTSSQCLRNFIDLMKTMETGKPRPWDTLKSLKLSFSHEWNEPASPSESIFLHIPSSVTTFHLFVPYYSDVSTHPDVLNLPIPENTLTNLTTFTLGCDWSGTKMWKVLQLCKNVETLTLDYGFSEISYHDDEPYFLEVCDTGLLLPKVHTLRLNHMRPNVVDFIHILETPMLVELDISFSNFARSPAHYVDLADALDNFCLALVAFIGRTRTLRKLRIYAVKMSKPQIRWIFTSLPHLTHLTLDNVWFDASILDDLSSEMVELTLRTPLPSLQVFELLSLPVDFPLQSLKRFIEDRHLISWAITLKKVVVTYQEYESVTDSEDAISGLEHGCPVEFSVGLVKSGSG
ncbi:hypothetical protein H1R20_g10464, partial [Candolleomyces eurysporus]